MKKILIILGIILFAVIAVNVIVPALVYLVKILIALGVCVIFGLGVWLGYSIGKRK